jgi:hypothetical protein
MATPKFDYPNATSPTSTLTFPQGGRLLRDSPQLINRTIITRRTQDDELLTWKRGDGKRVYPYTIRVKLTSVTETDMDDLMTFIDETVGWSASSFDWTDENSEMRTVKCVNDPGTGIQFERFGLDTAIAELVLEVQD